ncbi:MAG: tetratricopeptide repeat protein, partial [Acidobacteriota bacterium]
MAATDPRYRFVHREIVLVAMLAGITVAMFLLTRFVAEGDAALRRADAARLYADGLRDLDEGRVEDAVTALGRATARNPQAEPAWLALARALAEGRQEAAAGRVLMRLRDASPEDPDVNLELARLEVRRDDVASAVRFYQSALTALWRQGQAVERGRVRRELIRLLLDHQQPDRAMSEVLVLGVDLPADAASRNELGHLFLRAGSPSRAREQFARALEASPGDPDALAGAGEAA